MARTVINGEVLMGHGSKEKGYPEILISDGVGAGGGSLICAIVSFHDCRVEIDDSKDETVTRLWFGSPVGGVPIETTGIVEYSTPDPDPEKSGDGETSPGGNLRRAMQGTLDAFGGKEKQR